MEFYLGQITAIDGNVISIALAEAGELRWGSTDWGSHSGESTQAINPMVGT